MSDPLVVSGGVLAYYQQRSEAIHTYSLVEREKLTILSTVYWNDMAIARDGSNVVEAGIHLIEPLIDPILHSLNAGIHLIDPILNSPNAGIQLLKHFNKVGWHKLCGIFWIGLEQSR